MVLTEQTHETCPESKEFRKPVWTISLIAILILFSYQKNWWIYFEWVFLCIFNSMKIISKECQESKNSIQKLIHGESIRSFIDYRMTREKRTVAWNDVRLAVRLKLRCHPIRKLETIYSLVEKSHTKELIDNISVTNGELRVKILLLKYCFLGIRKNIADHVVRIKIKCE